MPITVKDLPPCLLVVYDVSRRGGQHFERFNERKRTGVKGEQISEWETKKVVDDEEELQRAVQLQTKAKREIAKLGAHSPVGLLVNESALAEVETARAQWEQTVREFNAEAKFSRLDFTLLAFRVTSENMQALERMLTTLRQALADLENAVRGFDPQSIRDVLKRMGGYVEVLPEEAAAVVNAAIERARKRARDISGTTKRRDRMERAIAEVVGPDADPMDELRRFVNNRNATAAMRKRAAELAKLVKSRNEAVDRLETLRTVVDDTPVRLARFAVMPPQGAAEGASEDNSGDLYAAEAAQRFAAVKNALNQ